MQGIIDKASETIKIISGDHMNKTSLSIILALVLTIIPFTFANTTVNVSGDDVVVNGSFGNTNFGSDTVLCIQSDSGGDYRVYQWYNLSSINLNSITNITLYAGAANAQGRLGALYNVSVYFCNDTFDQSTLTWNNQNTEVTQCESTPFYTIQSNLLPSSGWFVVPTNGTLLPKIKQDTDSAFSVKYLMIPEDMVLGAYYCIESLESTQPYFNMTLLSNTAPSINILAPANATSSSIRQNVSFTATDSEQATVSCNLYVDAALNLTNATVLNNTISYFAPNWAVGAHTFYITCSDGSLSGTSGTYTFTYARTLTVSPSAPANDTITTDNHKPVTFTAQDNKLSSFVCSLTIGGSMALTNSTVTNNTVTTFIPTWSLGTNLWLVNCSDSEISAQSGQYNLTLSTSLTIIAISPANETRTNLNEKISYEANDTGHANVSCALYIDSVLNATQNTINATPTNFSPSWADGAHAWYVSCTDGSDIANTGTYSFDYDANSPFISLWSPSSFNTTVFTGYAMQIKGNVTDADLWKVNRTIYYLNSSVFYNNYSGALPLLTTIYSWDATYNTSAMPNGIYTYSIWASDRGGINTATLSVSFELGNCVPSWSCIGFTACNISDKQLCNNVTDTNSCGLSYSGDYSGFGSFSCDYCLPARSYPVINDASTCSVYGYRNNTVIISNFATCCNVTKSPIDCVCNDNFTNRSADHLEAYNRMAFCLYTPSTLFNSTLITNSSWFWTGCHYSPDYSSDDIAPATVSGLGTALIVLVILVPIIIILSVGLWLYHHFRVTQ